MDIKPVLKKLKNDLIYFGVFSLINFLRLLSRDASISFMRYIGRMAYMFAVNERKNTIKNLTMAFGKEKSDKEIHELAKKVFLNISTCAADAVRLPVLVKDGTIDKIVRTENFHHFTDTVKRGKGMIAMTGHYGNWELMATWVIRQGYSVKVVAKKSYDPRFDKLIVGYRNEAGYANTARGSASHAVIEGLMNGQTYGLLFDIDTKVKGVFVDFFGTPAHTATGPVLLATKLGVPIVPIFNYLTSKNEYVITCLEELKLVNTGDEKKDVVTNTQICSDVYEKMIRLHPEQWIWMHRRWKKKPGDL